MYHYWQCIFVNTSLCLFISLLLCPPKISENYTYLFLPPSLPPHSETDSYNVWFMRISESIFTALSQKALYCLIKWSRNTRKLSSCSLWIINTLWFKWFDRKRTILVFCICSSCLPKDMLCCWYCAKHSFIFTWNQMEFSWKKLSALITTVRFQERNFLRGETSNFGKGSKGTLARNWLEYRHRQSFV